MITVSGAPLRVPAVNRSDKMFQQKEQGEEKHIERLNKKINYKKSTYIFDGKLLVVSRSVVNRKSVIAGI